MFVNPLTSFLHGSADRDFQGADLAHVFCSPTAAPVIKTYSPELIVHPSWASDSIAQWIDRFDAIVVGSELGRSEGVVPMVTGLVEMVKAKQIPIVIDGVSGP
jgi:ATP-dependent NAD(P)H-hydrate dehydratase